MIFLRNQLDFAAKLSYARYMSRAKQSKSSGINAAAWFRGQSFHQAESRPVPTLAEKPLRISEQWNATERRWYVVREWADGWVTREVL